MDTAVCEQTDPRETGYASYQSIILDAIMDITN